MELRLLGPVELAVDHQVFDVGPPQRRIVLAALGMTPAARVSTDQLVDRVWGDQPPAQARRALHAHLSRLRRMMAGLCHPGQEDAPRLIRRADGYLLHLDADRVDVHRLRRLASTARSLPDRDPAKLSALRSLVAISDEGLLVGLSSEWASQVRENWRLERLRLLEMWARAEMAHGNLSGVITRMSALSPDHLVAEPLAAILMRALGLAGQRVEALRVFDSVRRRLADEFGVEPGPQLWCLHSELVRNDAGCLATS
ncbi:BTAD domain-containing putative transcriptional regulator [Micromonospora profundi]|uniref:AfsR/SARP family transcriptional regulator n=1 Tax=Micromonospora profundi TaxID=1420889 RepID=UPI003651A0C6